MALKASRQERQLREHWLSFGDCCLAVSECIPEGPPRHPRQVLFFLHGRFGNADMWEPLASALADQYHCLRVDLPGFGRSFTTLGRGLSLHEQCGLIRSLISKFVPGPARAVLVGHDVGGAVAQLCALHEPERVAALVLINSAALTHPPGHLRTGYLCLRARWLLRELQRGLLRGISPACREPFEALSRVWRDRLGRTGLARAFQAWEQGWPGPAEGRAWRGQLRRLPQPVLVLWGLRDRLHPEASADDLLRQFPDAYFFAHEECGHWPCLEHPDWVDEKMREFLFQVSDARVADGFAAAP